MGDRFYNSQIKATGTCPGAKTKRKKKVSGWTDELKELVIQEYQDADPTPDNSVEIVKEIAERHEQSPNGVRMILSKAGVYVKTTPAAKSGGSAKKASGEGSKRVSKADAQAALVEVIEAAGQEVDEELIGKMTGKAMQYFTKVIQGINGAE